MEIQSIQIRIYEARGQKVMLDFDLAELYEVETRILNQAVKRNCDIFPVDFMFQLTKEEWQLMSSQFVTTYPEKRPKSAIPFAFTEHGVTMLANVLRSKKARETSVAVVRAFIALKQYTLTYAELTERLREIEYKYDKQFNDVYDAINYLINREKQVKDHQERIQIGFKSSK